MTEVSVHDTAATTPDAVIHASVEPGELKIPAHDPDMMLRFLRLLDPHAERFTVQLFRDPKGRKHEPLPPGLGGLIHHLTPAQIVAFAQKWNTPEHGFGMYVTVNETDFRGRETKNIVRVRAIIGDADKNPMETAQKLVGNSKPKPSMTVLSSEGRRQIYYLCSDCPLDQFKLVQQAFNEKYGTDTQVQDLPRVMRIPGTLHLKNTPQLVELKRAGGEVYTLDELLDGLELREVTSAPVAPRHNMTFLDSPEGRARSAELRAKFGEAGEVAMAAALAAAAGIGGWFDRLGDQRDACLQDALTALVDVADGNREGWIKVLMAVQASGAPGAYEVARAWSATSDKHTDDEFDKQWASFSDRPGGVRVGTLFAIAKERGWDSGPWKDRANGASWNGEEIHLQNADDLDPDDFSDYISLADAPMPGPREWVFGTELIKREVTVYAGPGGGGKTSRAVAQCCAIAANMPSILGTEKKIWDGGTNVLYVSSEDSLAEMNRRFKAAAKYYGLSNEAQKRIILRGKDSVRPIKLTQANPRTGNAEIDPKGFAELERAITHFKPSVVFLDPLQTFAPTGVNDGAMMAVLMARLKTIADAHGVSVCVVHHMRKGNGDTKTIEDMKGASELKDHARVALLVIKMTAAEAKSKNIPETEIWKYFRLGVGDAAKQNMSPPAEGDVWYQLNSIELCNGNERYPNGDSVQVVTVVPPNGFSTILSAFQAGVAKDAILKAVDAAYQGKQPISKSTRGAKNNRSWASQLPKVVKDATGCAVSERDLETATGKLIDEMEKEGIIQETDCTVLTGSGKSTKTARGLRPTAAGQVRLSGWQPPKGAG